MSFNPNPQQSVAINSDHHDILCISGPGSGKTSVLIARIHRLMAAGVAAHKIVVITFTNAAADEITKRLGCDVGYAGTLHGYMLRLIQQFAPHFDFKGPLTVIDEEERTAIFKELASTMRYTGSMAALSDACSKPMDNPTKPLDFCVVAYRRMMKREAFVDFDSILYFGLELLSAQKVVLPATHLFWDEFQDSGPLDAEIRDLLPIANKFTVGDPDQNLYSFRGGSVTHIMNLSRRPNVELIFLETNYRCDRLICEAAQRLISHNKNRIEKRTIPNSTKNGEVAVWNFEKPGLEIGQIAKFILERDASECAVLLRYNPDVGFYADALEKLGVKVARPESDQCPIKDWKRCRLFVSLLANPENNILAKKWLELTTSVKEANIIYLSAVGQKRSINQHHLRLSPTDVPNILPELVKRSFSPEAIKATETVVQRSPSASVAEIAMNMSLVTFGKSEKVDGCVVSTIHKAKGKEWDVVFLPAFEQQVLPAKKTGEVLEEERRVAFVAITRARHLCVISTANERVPAFKWKPEPASPSQFVAEAGL